MRGDGHSGKKVILSILRADVYIHLNLAVMKGTMLWVSVAIA